MARTPPDHPLPGPEFVASGTLPWLELEQWARALPDQEACWVLFEHLPSDWVQEPSKVPGVILTVLADVDQLPTPGRGRLFSAHLELQWENRGDSVAVRYLGSGSPGPPPSLLGSLQPLASECTRTSSTFFLWGRRVGRGEVTLPAPGAEMALFAEARIPRALRYPVASETTQHVGLQVLSYLEPSNGQRLYWRCCGTEERP